MLALGLDLGGTQVRAALIKDGTILQRAALRTDVAGGPEAVMRQFAALADEVAAGQPIAALGVATPGPLDTESGVVDHIPTLPTWDGFPLRDRLSQAFNLQAVVENDGIAAAYGEWRYGAGRGLQNVVYVTVSTGIGGGAVVDGQLLHGRRGMAAHVGHLHIATEGPVCSCGGTGCLEAFASGTALGQRAGAVAAARADSYLGQIRTTVTAHHAVAGARAGDAECLRLMADEARFLGLGFTSLAHLFSPDRLIMGGGVAQAFDLLSPGIHATLRAEALPPFKSLQVVAAELGDNAGLLGVAALALRAPRQG